MQKGKTSVLANKNLPNYITTIRILGTIALLFMAPLTPEFLIIYAISGLTDAIDGTIARKMGTISDFGSKLDSIADMLLYLVMLVKIFPVLWVRLPHSIWIFVGVILFVRLCAYIVAAKKYRKFAAQHTYMNKITGLVVFLIPFAIATKFAVAYCWSVCVVAVAASLEELVIHITAKEYNPKRKSILGNIA